jgi:hypothetical protein
MESAARHEPPFCIARGRKSVVVRRGFQENAAVAIVVVGNEVSGPRDRAMPDKTNLFGESFHFNERFLHDHAGNIVTDPNVAIIELIANAYDAGARNVAVEWPEELGGVFSVSDDGTGLTRQEFEYRWSEAANC